MAHTGDFTEATLATELVYRGGFFDVFRDEVRRPDGKPAVREYIKHPGAVMMVPLLDERTVILIRQFRYPLQRHFIELPAGKMEAGEAPLATAHCLLSWLKAKLSRVSGYKYGS